MNTINLTKEQRALRGYIRSFLLTANLHELERELEISLEKGDTFRAECIRELMCE